MLLESCIGRVLPDAFHAIPLTFIVPAAQTGPFGTGHPFFHDEMGPQIDATDLCSLGIGEGRETPALVSGKPG